MHWVRTRPPPELIVSVVYTALYAWRTAHRFSLELATCWSGYGAEAGDRHTYHPCVPLCPRVRYHNSHGRTTADQKRAHHCVLRQLAVRGPKAIQSAAFIDAALWTFNKARKGACASALRASCHSDQGALVRSATAGVLWSLRPSGHLRSRSRLVGAFAR